MRLLTLAAAVSLAFAAGCDRNNSTTPSPKTDTQSSAATSASGSTTTSGTTSSANGGSTEKNPTQGQVDPKHADQHRDFQQRGDQAGPKSSDTAPTMKN